MTHPLPPNWQQVVLKDISSKISDGLHSTPKYVDESNYYFVNGNNLIKDAITIADNTKCVSEEEYEKHKKDLNDSTVLLSINGTIGNVAYYSGEKVILGKSAAYINCSENVLRDFIFYYLKSSKTQNYFVSELTGSTIKNLSLASIKNAAVPLPPLPEQQRIVTILETWDKTIEKLERKIELRKNVKKGLMQQLLTAKKRLPGFSGEWKEVKLGDVADCLDNRRKPLNSEERGKIAGEYPYCGANGIVDYVNDYLFDEDIILIAEDGGYFDEYLTRPVAYRMNRKCWVNNHAHVIKAKTHFSQGFLFYSTVHKNLMPYLSGGTRAKLNKSELMKVTYFAPVEINEQKEIARILTSADREIELQQSKLQKLKDQKTYLLNHLITGRIRTPETMSIS